MFYSTPCTDQEFNQNYHFQMTKIREDPVLPLAKKFPRKRRRVFLYLSYMSGEGFLNKVVNEQNVEIPLTFFAGKSFPRINKSN